MSEEKSYVIGTGDDEVARLGLQHRVWQPSVLDLWRQAGITEGQTIIDAGAGPGHASADLAAIAGDGGRVIALERSNRFITALAGRRIANITAIETDLLEYDWPEDIADAVWCRWVLAFVADPPKVLEGMVRSLKRGGAIVIHEYFDYGMWRLAPRSVLFEDYVEEVIANWRASGGEPDIALALPHRLADLGLTIELVRPVVYTIGADNYTWRWPAAFARNHAALLQQQGRIANAAAIDRELARYEADPHAVMITPGVLQLVARKPA